MRTSPRSSQSAATGLWLGCCARPTWPRVSCLAAAPCLPRPVPCTSRVKTYAPRPQLSLISHSAAGPRHPQAPSSSLLASLPPCVACAARISASRPPTPGSQPSSPRLLLASSHVPTTTKTPPRRPA
ncbi:hypothetical protein PVAP13_3KG517300 [Panicum virgatum]|uniref:Uncharacterized protein n=1 Tax=Panicum virgatum TaxID=38727 RepID=A0A8T0VE50_PANVG|nr:hypothetical protein PVAP13_3KG517300 [Panicum virgatum]